MDDDGELLRRYVEEDSEQAFAELVNRHLSVVYAAALRQLGDEHRARDVVQVAFAALAQQARELSRRPSVLSWLYTAVHRRAANAKRDEWRRQTREREAVTTGDLPSTPERDPHWPHMRAVLDEAMHELPEDDREAVLLRFFQGLTYSELAHPLRVSEDGARKRVDRALDRLRGAMARRGITSTAAALASALSAQPPVSAPADLAALVLDEVFTATVAATATTSIALAMTATQKTLVAVALAAMFAAALHEFREAGRQRAQVASLQSSLARSEKREADLRAERLVLLTREPPTPAVLPEKPSPAPAAVAEPPPAPLRGMMLREAAFKILKDQTTLADSFVEKLGLSVVEMESFLSEVNRTRDRLNQLAVSHATIADGPAGSLVVTVAPFPEGQAVYDEFMANMSGLLGGLRARIFDNEYRGDALGWIFGNFGAGVRTIVISRTPPGFTGEVPGGVIVAIPNSEENYVIRDSAKSPNASTFVRTPKLGDATVSAILAPFADRLNAMPFVPQKDPPRSGGFP